MTYVSILQSRNEKKMLYMGVTSNLRQRMKAHPGYALMKRVDHGAFMDAQEAILREKTLSAHFKTSSSPSMSSPTRSGIGLEGRLQRGSNSSLDSRFRGNDTVVLKRTLNQFGASYRNLLKRIRNSRLGVLTGGGAG